MRVLLADADERFQEVVQAFLWERGHEAEIAADGLECLTVLQEFSPDVLVIDHGLLWGGSDGVISHMREEYGLRGVPVIVIADEVPSKHVHAAMDSTVLQWLQRPFWLPHLLTRIDSVTRLAKLAKLSESVAETF